MSPTPSTTRSVASSINGHDEKRQSQSPSPTLVASGHASTSSITTKSSLILDVHTPFLPKLSTFQLLVVHIGLVGHHTNNVVVNPISITSAALTLFLATTDAVRTFAPLNVLQLILPFQTIVSTSLPTIASDLEASPIQYTWVGVAYMLTQTAFQPLYGRASDLVGRKVHISSYLSNSDLNISKNVLYSSMAIFAMGSALCGAAQVCLDLSFRWLFFNTSSSLSIGLL